MLEVVLTIPLWLELGASLTGGLSGAMSAVRARYDIFGVACIAIVTGLAGGIIRDVLLQNYGIYAFQNPSLIVCCVIASIIVFYFGRLTTYLDPVVDLLDNLSVALWTIIAVGKASSAGLDIFPAAILGTLSAVGGGICRDISMNKEPTVFQAGSLYGSAAFIGAFAYALMYQNHILSNYAAITCVVLVLGIRYCSRLFDWNTHEARDYSYLVTKPVKSVVNKVRPPKGKTERDRANAKYEKAVRILKKLFGMPVDQPLKSREIAPEAPMPNIPVLRFQSRASAIAEHEAELAAKAAESSTQQESEETDKTTTSWRASSSAGASAATSPAMASAKVFRDAFAEEEAAQAQEEQRTQQGSSNETDSCASAQNASQTSDDTSSHTKRAYSQNSDRIRVAPGELQHILGHDKPSHTTSHLTIVAGPSDNADSTTLEDAQQNTAAPDRTTSGIDVLVTPEAASSPTPKVGTDPAIKKAAEAYRSNSPKYHSNKE